MKKSLKKIKQYISYLAAKLRFKRSMRHLVNHFNVRDYSDILKCLKCVAQYWHDFYAAGYNIHSEELEDLSRIQIASHLIDLIDDYEKHPDPRKEEAILQYFFSHRIYMID